MFRLLYVLSYLFSLLPEVLADWFARALAVMFFDVLRIRRPIVLRNLAIAFPDGDLAWRKQVARQSYKHTVLTALEFMRGIRINPIGNVNIEGEEHIHNALAQGSGVFILCAHFGNWEAMGAKIGSTYGSTHVLVKPVGSPATNQFVNMLRRKYSFLPIERAQKGDGLRAILQALGRNEIVGFVMDQSRPGEPRVPFFSEKAQTNTGLASLWRKRQNPIIPAYMVRTAFGKHVLRFLPAVTLDVSSLSASASGEAANKATREQATLICTEHFNRVLEHMIRQAPEQYFWLHNRWK